MRSEQLERVRRPVDPQIVAVDRQEWIAVDDVLGVNQSAARFEQQVALIGNDDVKAFDGALQMRLQGVRQIMDVDHDLLDPGRANPLDHMIEKRLAGDFD